MQNGLYLHFSNLVWIPGNRPYRKYAITKSPFINIFLWWYLSTSAFLLCIGNLQVSFNVSLNSQSLLCYIFRCLVFSNRSYYWHNSQVVNLTWGASVDNLKRCLFDSPIYHTVVREINLRQYSFPILLFVTTNTAQHIT